MSPSPDGFRSVLSLMQMVYIAYVSADSGAWLAGSVVNLPPWQGQFYDIAAKVSQADLTAWQHQGRDYELLRAAMRTALRERFHLAAHEQPSTGEIFELVVAKGGPRLKPTDSANDPRSPGLTEKDRPADGSVVQKTQDGRSERIIWDKAPAVTSWCLPPKMAYQCIPLSNRPGGGVIRSRQRAAPRRLRKTEAQ